MMEELISTGTICLCSRGLIFAKTVQMIFKNIRYMRTGWDYESTWDEPIPDAQNGVVGKALANKGEWLWFVEEDMLPHPDALVRMLLIAQTCKAQIVTVDYNIDTQQRCRAIVRDGDNILYGGMGCLLVHRKVFENWEQPYFETTAIRYIDGEPAKLGFENQYGGQDIGFYARAFKAGLKIEEVLNLPCGHLKLVEFNDSKTNDGVHKIMAI
jgi:hypothetical protein